MLISKDENFRTSSVYIASLILKHFNKKKTNKLNIFDIAQELKKHNIVKYRQIISGLFFLYTTGIIDFWQW
ncbi:hypothetical protein GCM10011378_00010 [Hymenobacter glacieicola]|uniref:Uncharacterized protein n=1 Tax=Hymenobacter glacieicola TaxID=1562124 RepID=A0ABQ1WEA0_9BACT|nr:hypothetical protein GCM10011378_00010 [Hymenobacter glacieicola]